MYQESYINRCFLSYNSKDKSLVIQLGKDLLRNGVDVWFDEWEIKAGDSISSNISEGLRISNIFIIIMSPNSMKSNWVKEELAKALYRRVNDRNFRIIPILYRKCKIDEISMLLPDLSFLDFRYKEKYQANLEKLIDSIRQFSNKPPISLEDTDLSKILAEIPQNYLRKNAIYYESVASEFTKSGKYTEAIPFLEKAIIFDPNFTSAYFSLASIHSRLGNYEKALEYYEKVVKLDSKHSAGWFGLAVYNVRLGNYEAGVKYYKKVLELDPNNSTAINGLGVVLHRLLHYEEALYYYQKTLEVQPQNYYLKIESAKLLITMRRIDDAENYIKEVLAYSPNDVEAKNVLMMIKSAKETPT